ncbi:MAG TPA: hypothetical protein VF856_09505, partial [Gemmatimonadaceae bacterium]
DIPILVEYLVDRFAKQAGKTIRNIEKQTMQRLAAYDWPGNVRTFRRCRHVADRRTRRRRA